MGRHIRILLLAAAAQPVLAFPEHFGLLLVVFFGSIVLVAASIGASCISLGCHKARGQCKIAVTACALLNVFFIVVWTVYVAVAVTEIKRWSDRWWIFVADALAAFLAVAVAGDLILRARAPDPPDATHEAGTTIQVPVSTKETA